MNDDIQICRQNIARLSSWRGWLNFNRKYELAHYKNMLAVLLRAEQQYDLKQRLADPVLKRKGSGYGQTRITTRA